MSLRRLAARAVAPVFPVIAGSAADLVPELRCDGRVRLVSTPRHATVLLLADVPADSFHTTARVHDQLPHPRSTVWWGGRPPTPFGEIRPAPVRAGDALIDDLVRAHEAVLVGTRPSEPSWLPDEPPAPWRGIGPHGQGGEGMMGGRPYGRPMAMTAPDRDGLALDALRFRVGPHFPAFPAGLTLDVVLQGDVVQQATVVDDAPRTRTRVPATRRNLFERALHDAVPVADLELARARHHLAWLAGFLELHGLAALSRRALAVASVLTPGGAAALTRLRRRVERPWVLDPATAGVGPVTAGDLHDVAGPVARAASVAVDARADDPVYQALGFTPVTTAGADARARWRQRLAEAEQAVVLADRATARDLRTRPTGRVEGPRGPMTRDGGSHASLLAILPALLSGLDWGEAVTTVASLDLDPADAPAEQRA